MNLLGLIKMAGVKRLLRAALKSALKTYVNKTPTPVDDAIYSMVIKLSEGNPIDDELNFLVNHFIKK